MFASIRSSAPASRPALFAFSKVVLALLVFTASASFAPTRAQVPALAPAGAPGANSYAPPTVPPPAVPPLADPPVVVTPMPATAKTVLRGEKAGLTLAEAQAQLNRLKEELSAGRAVTVSMAWKVETGGPGT